MRSSSTKVDALEKSTKPFNKLQLWQTLDQIRINSGTKFDEFYKATFGLFFVAYLNRSVKLFAKGKSPIKLPKEATWELLLSTENHSVRDSVNQAMLSTEEANKQLLSISFPDFSHFNEQALCELLRTLDEVFRKADQDDIPQLFDFLLDKVARAGGIRSGEFSTPREVTELMIKLIDPRSGMTVYDPCVGAAGFLRAAVHHVKNNETVEQKIKLYGQDSKLETLSLAKIGLAISGVFDADLQLGDTLREPRHIAKDCIVQFDRVISNPPFGLKISARSEELEQDRFNRFKHGPSGPYADFAFIQHMIASMKPNGVMAVATTLGVLFRDNREGHIRKSIIKEDLIEAVIGLPECIFPNAMIPSAILILNKAKSPKRVGKVLFINGKNEFVKDGRHNRLQPDNIERIVSTFQDYSVKEKFSTVATLDRIRENDFNLSLARYADSSPVAG